MRTAAATVPHARAGNGHATVRLLATGRLADGWLGPSYVAGGPTLSLAQQIAERIAAAIVQGTYAQGERLQEQGIAEAFGTSRGPVRDALQLLAREGLVVIQARRGASVQVLSAKDVREIFEVRAALYGLAAESIATRAERETLAVFRASVGELGDALALRDPQRFLEAIFVKSMDVADACGNDILRGLIIERGRQTLSLTRRVMIVRENQERWYQNWRALARAVVAGDPAKADAAGRRLVRDVQRMVLALFEPGAVKPEPSNDRRTRRPT